MASEQQRLDEARERAVPWKKWGPYLSERQWGTVREDYSDDGDAWDYFSHDQARSRAYRWGEDGIAGISDDRQRLCFAVALWNGQDPILKERLFGLTNSEGNHGEDVKEYYFYLDSSPTHAYMKYLYKYPQRAYAYEQLVRVNRGRSREEPEYELLDTGIFGEGRYFDVFVEYAKAAPEEILIRITVVNRGPEAATLHVLPHLWFRNTWRNGAERPRLWRAAAGEGAAAVVAAHPELGQRFLLCEAVDGTAPELLFTENETNSERLFGQPNPTPYVKDGINNYLVHGQKSAVNPEQTGTKAAVLYHMDVPAGGTQEIRLRLSEHAQAGSNGKRRADGRKFNQVFRDRLDETDAFYAAILPARLDDDTRNVVRQALAGMLWSKQFYALDVEHWLAEHNVDPLRGQPSAARNRDWFHMVNADIISMPDKWEYPWYAAWDLAFHTVALSMVDRDFAHQQLLLMLNDQYLHPNGQIPAYEWNFSDVNPPVHAWATLFGYNLERIAGNDAGLELLRHAFPRLLLNFTWWVNRKDPSGRNVFEGGFLGLDNIGVFDRSAPLPTGGRLEQADGTAWMAFYSQTMLKIALNLALEDPSYESLALKFTQHFLWIASAMDRIGDNNDELWDEQDGFFYDVLRLPDERADRLKVRSLVGLLPLCAATVIPERFHGRFPRLLEQVRAFLETHPTVGRTIAPLERTGINGRRLLAVLDERKLRRVLAYMLDEEEFFSPYGIRSLSRYYAANPYTVHVQGMDYQVSYLPAESNTGMFGGNSNWRGPVWMPINALIVRALLEYYLFYGESFTVECPSGSGVHMTLFEVARELTNRLARIFLRGPDGHRPVYGGAKIFQQDPHWRDYVLFYEYFHGDNGAGIGASHQTGWTGVVARLIQIFGITQPETFLAHGFDGPREEPAHQVA